MERALVLLACGLGHINMHVGANDVTAAMLVSMLGLEDFVDDRVSYRLN